MKPVEEMYYEITESDELKKAYARAKKDGRVTEFLKEHGCAATEEEISSFLAKLPDGQLSDDELDNVAGGACGGTMKCLDCGREINKSQARGGLCYECWKKKEDSRFNTITLV